MRPSVAERGPGMDWRLLVIRLVVVLNVSLALNYIGWRYVATIYWPNWYIAIPLLVAETYSVIDTCLFSMTMWRARHRQPPPEARSGLTVDVFITCYNEPVELVSQTVRAALKIQYPHRTYVLDDGASDLMRAMAASEGVEYISRADQWSGYSRHAKAGNLNHALMQTEGEFLLILDADQMPRPAILDRTLGYFDDPRMAFVQTPQFFYNVTDDDILGAQAPLFYGPLQEGKDGWNAAFFCGSNAVLRREALMQLGITRYVAELERRVPDALATSARVLRRARKELKHLEPNARRSATASLDELEAIVRSAQAGIAGRKSIQAVTWTFQERVRGISTRLVEADLAAMRADLAALAAESGGALDITFEASGLPSDPDIVAALAGRTTSPIIAIGAIRELLLTMDIDRVDEAQALMPMATLSVTEDMATAMRLHASGWKSAFHNELLADGLAPDDLRSTMQQRLRWAQGTLQVFFRENPLGQRGLSLGQRLMYFATMYSYFSGFFVVIYLLAPILFLTLGVKPVTVYSLPFFLRLIPFLVVNQLLFQVAGWKVRKWRGQQYSVALFPLWIKAVLGTVRNVYFGRDLPFVVTPKTRQVGGSHFGLVRWQVVAMLALVSAAITGLVRLALGINDDIGGVSVNLLWVGYDLAALSVVIRALRFRPAGEAVRSNDAERDLRVEVS